MKKTDYDSSLPYVSCVLVQLCKTLQNQNHFLFIPLWPDNTVN